jgi:hypothetical protein
MVQRDYFTALLEYVRGEIKAGKGRDELVKSSTVLKVFPITVRSSSACLVQRTRK